MATTVKAGWLKDSQGNKFAPKTIASQVTTNDGTTLEDFIQNGSSVSWNDLQDKPFYEKEPVETVLIPETTFTGNSKVISSDISSLTVGETYTVVWDGTTYNNLVCHEVSGLAAIGASDFTFADYPFLIGIDNGNCNIMASTNTSHTVKVTGMVSEVVPLDRKYVAEYLDSMPVYAGRKVEGVTGAEIFNNYNTNTASAGYAHAEGSGTTASGTVSHAEGFETLAEGSYSHAQGYKTQATGNRAHSEGQGSVASGSESHAEGSYTIAAGNNQHAQGKYNVEDTVGLYAHIVGNGTNSTNRKNAHTLDWSGNAWFAGGVHIGGTSQEDSASIKTDTDSMNFEGVDMYEFDNHVKTTGRIYTNGKKSVNDSDYGAILGEGNLVLQANTPSVRFRLTDSVDTDAQISLYTNDVMTFDGATRFKFYSHITTPRLFTGDKTSSTDGIQGSALGYGILDLQNLVPEINFYSEGSTSENAKIYLLNGILHFLGNNATYFDNSSVYVDKSLGTNQKESNSDGKAGVFLTNVGSAYLQHASTPILGFYVGDTTEYTSRIYANASDYMNFNGAARYSFDAQLYSTNSTIATSDRNKKKDFAAFDERYEKLFFDLKPQVYKFKDGTSDRFHSGFVSQEVEESMFKNGLDSKDFAGYCKDIQRRIVSDTEEGIIEEEVYDENGNPVYDYMLRYEEFIALNTHMLQKAYEEIRELKAEIEQLKNK